MNEIDIDAMSEGEFDQMVDHLIAMAATHRFANDDVCTSCGATAMQIIQGEAPTCDPEAAR